MVPKELFSLKYFVLPLAIFAVLVIAITLWLNSSTKKTNELIAERLDQRIVAIESTGMSEAERIQATIAAKMGVSPEEASSVNIGLAEAPIEGLYIETDYGLLPMIRREDKLTPFNAYRRRVEGVSASTKGLIGIALYDFGFDQDLAVQAVEKLGADITFILSPYTPLVDVQARLARSHGHEIWLEVPFQTEDYPYTDPGPNTLLVEATVTKNDDRLFRTFGSAVGYVGVVPQQGEIYSVAQARMEKIMSVLSTRGLALANAEADDNALLKTLAIKNNMPYVQNQLWLNKSMDPAELEKNLRLLEAIAMERGSAVAFGYLTPQNVETFATWAAYLGERDLDLAPLSAFVKQ